MHTGSSMHMQGQQPHAATRPQLGGRLACRPSAPQSTLTAHGRPELPGRTSQQCSSSQSQDTESAGAIEGACGANQSAGMRRCRGRGARGRALGDGPQVHEVAVAAARARVLLVLAAGGLPEVGHGAEFHQDGPPRVEAAAQALQRARGRILVVELRARAPAGSARMPIGPKPMHS
jgi:hypothetical protein